MGTSYGRTMPLSSSVGSSYTAASYTRPSFGVSCAITPYTGASGTDPSFRFSCAISSSVGSSRLTIGDDKEPGATSIRSPMLLIDSYIRIR
jgi:hypothetical protein